MEPIPRYSVLSPPFTLGSEGSTALLDANTHGSHEHSNDDASSDQQPAYEHEIEIKRSRFICQLYRVSSEEAARQAIRAARTSHPGARHHCTGFAIGPRRDIQRSSDDGEPAGTAGAPIVDTLARYQGPTGHADLSDVCAVVIRYFGGIKLGTGGLSRAYGQAVSEALLHSRVVIRELMQRYTFTVGMAEAGRVEGLLRTSEAMMGEVTYGPHHVEMELLTNPRLTPIEELTRSVASVSKDPTPPTEGDAVWVDRC